MGYSAVKKRVSRVKGEEDDSTLSNLNEAVNPGNCDEVEKMIREDPRITFH